MKVQLLPTTIDETGQASLRQHLMSIIIDDRVAIDAGSLAFSCTDIQRRNIRDIILTHTHLDHIAGLPLFIDDLFASLEEPVRVHATPEMIDILERDIFNWSVYPRFSELRNDNCSVVEYCQFEQRGTFTVQHLEITSVPVNHQVSAMGYIISDGSGSVAITGDTAETEEIWKELNGTRDLSALLVECAFPDRLSNLAAVSHHLTPSKLKKELGKLHNDGCEIHVINMKPMYREEIIDEIRQLGDERVRILEVGKVYEW